MDNFLGQKRTARILGTLSEVFPGVDFEGKAELDVYRDTVHGICVYADWSVTAANRKVRVGHAAPIPIGTLLIGANPFDIAMARLVEQIEAYELGGTYQGAKPFRVSEWEWVSPGPSLILPN